MKAMVRNTVMFVGLLVSTAIPAMAQAPTRVSVNTSAPIFVLPDAKLVPLRTAAVGTTLNVQLVEGDWYRVEFQDPQFGRRVGYIEKRFVTARSEAMDLTVPEAPLQAPRLQLQPQTYQPSARGVLQIPSFETSMGWAVQRVGGETSTLGWSLDLTKPVTPWFSTAIEVSGQYGFESADTFLGSVKADAQDHAFLSGPKFGARLATGRVNLYGQFLGGLLVGRTHVNLFDGYAEDSRTKLYPTIQPGGGLEIALTDRVGVRMAVDARVPFVDGGHVTAWRFTPGVVIRTGSKN